MKSACFLFSLTLFFSFMYLCCPKAFTQKQQLYHERMIRNLCSEKMLGRGYVNRGDKKASAFIRRQLKKHNAKPLSNSYFQPFRIPVNTFPGDMELSVDGHTLRPGLDFLVDGRSGSAEGSYKILPLDSNFYFPGAFGNQSFPEYKNVFILIDTLGKHVEQPSFISDFIIGKNPFKAAGYIEKAYNSLHFYPALFALEHPVVRISHDNLPPFPASLSLDIENRHHFDYKTRNVAGLLHGKIDSFLIFTAHYDHLGPMGDEVYFPGAHDNASGVAMCLELCKFFSQQEELSYNIAFIFFSGEEIGLLGSRFFVENPLIDLNKIKFLINLDLVGSGDEGITVVNGSVFKKQFARMKQMNHKHGYLPVVRSRGPAANSDHWFFYDAGVPCFFIYTLGEYKQYHNIFDTTDNVPLNRFTQLKSLLIEFVSQTGG